MNSFLFIAALSLLVGWHLDEIDTRLIEENRHALAELNIPHPQPVIIDTDERGRPVIRREL